MTPDNSSQLITVPHALTRDAFDEINARARQHKPISPLDQYQRKILYETSWEIKEQPVKILPRSLTELISLQLRDEGNALIEETRQLNNQYAGQSFSDVKVQSLADLNFIELRHKLLLWAEEVIKTVLYKHRRQFQEDPFNTYLKHHKGFISVIDQTIAHGANHLYSITWSSVLDAMPYWMLDRALFQSGKVYIEYTKDEAGVQKGTLNATNGGLANRSQEILLHGNLYGVEPTTYSKRLALQPLLTTLKETQHFPPLDVMQKQVNLIMGDILEAVPYLLNNKCYQQYLFDVPGTSCVGGFLFLSPTGIGQFCFNDSRELWIEGHQRSFYRGMLELDFFGQLTYYMHPWMSLERSFGVDDGLLLTYWLLKQIHPNLVQEYLRVEKYYLHKQSENESVETEREVSLPPPWQIPAIEEDFEEVTLDQPVITGELRDRGLLQQMRRTRFFKVLNLCGVRVEQGKGSELKLLKDGAHPFRLGNHYGPNPTVPSFIVDSILKRMQISHEQWRSAMAAV